MTKHFHALPTPALPGSGVRDRRLRFASPSQPGMAPSAPVLEFSAVCPIVSCKTNSVKTGSGGPHCGPDQAVKKVQGLFRQPEKCRYFCAPQRRKSPRFACRNPCTARLPGHLIPLEAGGCPLELPRPDSGGFDSAQVLRETEDHLPAGRRSDALSFSPPFKGGACLCFLFQNTGPLEPYSAPLSRS